MSVRAFSILALALAVAACGASNHPAEAAPRKQAAPARGNAKPPVRAPRAVVTAIGAGNVERVKKAWEVAAGGVGRAVALSSRLGRVAFGGKDGVDLFDLGTGKAVGSVKRCRDLVHAGVAFHGSDLWVVCEKSVVVVDALKLTPKHAPSVNASRVTATQLAGTHLALAHHDGVLRIYALDGSATIEIKVPGPPIDAKSLALSRDAARIAVAWVQGSVWWWNPDKPDEPHDLVRHESESDALAFSDDGSLLAEEGEKNTTTLWTFGPSASEKTKIKNGNWVKRFAFTRDGKWLARGGSDGLELRRDRRPEARRARHPQPGRGFWPSTRAVPRWQRWTATDA